MFLSTALFVQHVYNLYDAPHRWQWWTIAINKLNILVHPLHSVERWYQRTVSRRQSRVNTFDGCVIFDFRNFRVILTCWHKIYNYDTNTQPFLRFLPAMRSLVRFWRRLSLPILRFGVSVAWKGCRHCRHYHREFQKQTTRKLSSPEFIVYKYLAVYTFIFVLYFYYISRGSSYQCQ
jgi:hypothetical protein